MIGRKVAKEIYDEIREGLKGKEGRPHLAIILVGDDKASKLYIKYKKKACEDLGFNFSLLSYDSSITTEFLQNEIITKVNNNTDITGCIIQLPLPNHITKDSVLHLIDPKKDVDGFHYINVGKLALNFTAEKLFVPATALGIYKIIKYLKPKTKGKLTVVIGKSDIVGKPISMLLSNEFSCASTVVMCDKYTENLWELTKMADIIIVAAGVHHLLKNPDHIKKGAFIVDVGIHRVWSDKKNKLVTQGDCDYNGLKDKAGFITPVPGGVGPTTVACLMLNLFKTIEVN